MQTAYISTYLGNRFYPIEGRINDIQIEDIAHGLAYQCRFNGQTNRFYSVAEHSLMVADLVPPAFRRAALLHDAAEAYLGDMVKPLKVLLPAFSDIEDKVTQLIAQHFKLDFSYYDPIKAADLKALATEKRDLMPHSIEDWSYLAGIRPVEKKIEPLSPQEAKERFLERFREYFTSPMETKNKLTWADGVAERVSSRLLKDTLVENGEQTTERHIRVTDIPSTEAAPTNLENLIRWRAMVTNPANKLNSSQELALQTSFNAFQWSSRCKEIADDAGRNCGGSDTMYVQFVSRDIEQELALIPPADRVEAEKIARKFDYMSPEELQASEKENANTGSCSHGLDPDFCPAGFGEIDADEDSSTPALTDVASPNKDAVVRRKSPKPR